MRILEAVIAAIIIFLVFSISTFLIRSSDVRVLQERGDLDRLGYNVISGMIDSGTIEDTLENGGVTLADASMQMQTYIQRSLPISTYFNLTLFAISPTANGWINQTLLFSVSNALASTFSSSVELSSTPTIYTSKGGNIYNIVLILARAGGGMS
jgi:hypothetical protein